MPYPVAPWTVVHPSWVVCTTCGEREVLCPSYAGHALEHDHGGALTVEQRSDLEAQMYDDWAADEED